MSKSGMIRSDKTEAYRKQTAINENIIEQIKDKARFTYLLHKLRKVPVDYWEFNVQEAPDDTRHTKVNNGSGYAIGATAIVVDDESVFSVNQRIWNPDKDDYTTVTAITPGTHTLTVDALVKAWSDNDLLVGLAQGVPEGGAFKDMVYPSLVNAKNYTQQMVRTIPISWREAKAPKYGPNELAVLRKQAYELFWEDIESELIFGDKHTKTESSGAVTTYTGGLHHWLSTNALAATGGSVTESAFIGFLQDLAYAGNRDYILLDGGALINQITSVWALGDRMVTNEKLSGLLQTKVMKYDSTFGSVSLVFDPMIAKAFSHMGTPEYEAYVVSLDDLGLAVYQEQTHLSGIADNNVTADTEAWFADYGLWISREPAMGVITGLT